jgi:hypothetical protein
MALINKTLNLSLKTFKVGLQCVLAPLGAIASSKTMTIYFLISKENHPEKHTQSYELVHEIGSEHVKTILKKNFIIMQNM